jgi:small-conductance mechanosensitive channel
MTCLKKIISSLLLFIFFFVVATIYKKNNEKNKPENNLIIYEMKDIIYYLILFFGLFFSLIHLGFQTTSIYGIFGSIGILIGIALQSTLSIVLSGFYISLNNLYQIGDMIQISGPNGQIYRGKVSAFSLFYTKIISKDNTISVIPNNYIQNNIVNLIILN